MGPTGRQSTLAATLLGHPSYEVTSGAIRFLARTSRLATDVRGKAGLFLAFQYPEAIAACRDPVPPPGHFRAHRPRGPLGPRVRLSMASGWSASAWIPPSRAPLERGVLRRREEAQRDPPDGPARPSGRRARRDRLWPRHRRAARRRAWGAHRARGAPRARRPRGHALPAPPRRACPDRVHLLVDGRVVESGVPSSPNEWSREATTSGVERNDRRARHRARAQGLPLLARSVHDRPIVYSTRPPLAPAERGPPAMEEYYEAHHANVHAASTPPPRRPPTSTRAPASTSGASSVRPTPDAK